MQPDTYRRLQDMLARFTQIDHRWVGVLCNWINAADGYIECMTMDNNCSTVEYLLTELADLLSAVPDRINNSTFTDSVIAHQFPVLYMHATASGDSQPWDCLKESFQAFRERTVSYPHQVILDFSSQHPETALSWLTAFFDADADKQEGLSEC